MGVNIKLLDLIIQDNYYGMQKQLTGNEAIAFGKSSYASLESIISYLEQIADNTKNTFHLWNSYGIPRSGYFIGKQWIQVKDCSRGAKYSQECIHNCPYFSTCNEGLFSPFLSVGEILHLSGCRNKNLYYNLSNKTNEEIQTTFNNILDLFENTEYKQH